MEGRDRKGGRGGEVWEAQSVTVIVVKTLRGPARNEGMETELDLMSGCVKGWTF